MNIVCDHHKAYKGEVMRDEYNAFLGCDCWECKALRERKKEMKLVETKKTKKNKYKMKVKEIDISNNVDDISKSEKEDIQSNYELETMKVNAYENEEFEK